MSDEVATLSSSDIALLSRLEMTIERGIGTFLKVGSALMEIRDKRLYRETHRRFEDYCQERWGFTDRRARQMIEASQIGTMVPVSNERQARELAPLLDEPEQLRDAWQEASESGQPTALKVRQAVERRKPIILDGEALERHQRDNVISVLDGAVFALEGPTDSIAPELDRVLVWGPPGPLVPSRFERVVAYATAYAAELRKRGIDG